MMINVCCKCNILSMEIYLKIWIRDINLRVVSIQVVFHPQATRMDEITKDYVLGLLFFPFFFFFLPGESTDTVFCCHKLCSWVSHFWGNHRDQHIRMQWISPALGKPPAWLWYLPCHVSISLLNFKSQKVEEATETKEQFQWSGRKSKGVFSPGSPVEKKYRK